MIINFSAVGNKRLATWYIKVTFYHNITITVNRNTIVMFIVIKIILCDPSEAARKPYYMQLQWMPHKFLE